MYHELERVIIITCTLSDITDGNQEKIYTCMVNVEVTNLLGPSL